MLGLNLGGAGLNFDVFFFCLFVLSFVFWAVRWDRYTYGPKTSNFYVNFTILTELKYFFLNLPSIYHDFKVDM